MAGYGRRFCWNFVGALVRRVNCDIVSDSYLFLVRGEGCGGEYSPRQALSEVFVKRSKSGGYQFAANFWDE